MCAEFICIGLWFISISVVSFFTKILHLREGDASTSFFHQQACHRHRRNIISMLRSGSEIATGQEEIARAVDAYYSSLFEETPPRTHTIALDRLWMPSFDLSHLEALFMEGEVEKVVKAMPLDKAPGPDGFT